MAGLLENIIRNVFLNSQRQDSRKLFDQYQNDAMIPKSVDITPQGTNPKNFDYNTLARMPTAADLAPYYARALALGQDPTGQMKLQQFQDQSRSDARSLNAQRQPLADILAAFKPGKQSISSPQSNENPSPMSGQVSAPANPTLQTILPQLLKLYQAGGDTKPIESLFKTAQGEPFTLNPKDIRYGPTGQVIARGMPEEQAQDLSPDQALKLGFNPGSVVTRKPGGGYEVAQAGAKPYAPLSDQEVADKAKLAAAETSARAKAQLETGVPDEASLRLMATQWLHGDRGAAAGMSRNVKFQSAFRDMMTKVAGEQGLDADAISRNLQNFNGASQTINAFDKGRQGDATRSLNVVVQHASVLGTLAKALANHDVPVINSIQNWWKTNVGSDAPTNVQTAVQLFRNELQKATLGGPGGEAERLDLLKGFTNASPEAQVGMIGTGLQFATGQLKGLRQQYQSSTGRQDFNDKLSPETIAVLDATAKIPAALPQPHSAAERDALPPGTKYVAPDGSVRLR